MTNFPKSMQSVLQSSGRAPGAMGSKFSHIFLREVSLGEKLYFGGKMICCNFFLTNKELMDRKMKSHKDKIEIISKAASHKLPGSSSLNVNFLFPVCPSLFVQHVTFYLSDMLI